MPKPACNSCNWSNVVDDVDGGPFKDNVYEDSLFHFVTALRLLIEEAGVQCALMGYHNVAWEIRDDVVAWAEGVMEVAGERLSPEQRHSIRLLSLQTSQVPDDTVNAMNTREGQIRAMDDPVWKPIRARAAELLALLEPERKRVENILWPLDNVQE